MFLRSQAIRNQIPTSLDVLSLMSVARQAQTGLYNGGDITVAKNQVFA
jgi:hypothetical protein